MPPKTPRRVRKIIVGIRNELNIQMQKKTKLMPNPAIQEVLMSSLFLKNLPGINEPNAMPTAVNKKR